MVNSDYFPIHAHSEFSALDGMGTVEAMVAKVAKMGQPGLALTDHGNMAGAIRLYKQCREAGIAPFPGSEFYVVTDATDKNAKEDRYHLGMVCLNFDGFKGMTKLSSRSHLRDRYHRKPLIDFDDLAQFGVEHGTDVVVTTGCYFGLVIQTLLRRGDVAGHQMIDMLHKWFPNLAVELQYHDIHDKDHDEDELADWLFAAADRHGLPVVLGQDSHYCDAEHQPVHDLMKDICYFGDGEDNRFPGGPYHLADTDWLMKPWSESEWNRIDEGHGWVLDQHKLVIPALEKYQFHVPSVSKFPHKALTFAVNEGLAAMGLNEIRWDESDGAYQERAAYELDVIDKMKMSDYFLLVKEVVDWCHDNNVVVNCRGSVNGSLVCYLLGISTVDPIQWGTRFDRFLSLARMKPPDIDMDVESGARYRLVEHVRKKFPTMVHIGTYNRLGITEQDDGSGEFEDKGSVFVQYMAAMRRKVPNFDNRVQPEHRQTLNDLADLEVRKSFGVHAAGLVLPTPDHRIEDYLATGLVASSNTTATQAVMEDVEDAGFMKLDVLGLRALETLSTALDNLGKRSDEWDWIPWDDKRACALLSAGATDGVFQFEGWTTRKGGKEMKIRSTMDVIICLALYRPALINGGQKDQYLGNRGKPKSKRPYRLHPFFDKALDVTDGVPVFQEQVMEMCLDLGMDEGLWNKFMKAVKASNDKIGQYAIGIMEEVEPIFYDLCEAKGLSMDDADDAWHAISGFTEYGFNRAHATGYGIASYRSAYLKAHHPLEYMHAVLDTWVGSDKESDYVKEARSMGFDIARPDVSYSQSSWVIDKKKYRNRQVLRRGLQTIKGIGPKVADAIVENRPEDGWSDIAAFVESMPGKVSGGKEFARTGNFNGKIEILRQAGALESLGIPDD